MPYLENGQEVEVVGQVDGDHIVRAIYADGDREELAYGPLDTARKIYDNPPTAKRHEQISLLDAKIIEANKELHSIKAEVESTRQQRKEFDSQIQLNAAMKRVYDLVITGIKFVVTEQYGTVKIVDTSEKVKEDEGRPYSPMHLRLLTLFGSTNGDLAWNLTKYSNNYNEIVCVPFTNHAEALAFAKTLIHLGLQAEHAWQKEGLIASAKEHGVELPVEIQRRRLNAKLKSHQEQGDAKMREAEAEANHWRECQAELEQLGSTVF